jgi:protein ImuB
MNPPELYACLLAREFPAQALLRLRPELHERPCAVLDGEAPLQFVCSLNSKARALGVTCGMTPVELDTFPSVVALSRSISEETAAAAVLLECAGNFSPRLEQVPNANAFLCVLDIAGTEKLFGQPQDLASTLRERAKSLGITACIAVSSNFHTAICLARGMVSSRRIIVATSAKNRDALAELPLSVLDLSEEHAEIFSLWGIHTLGLLAALPQKDLIARLGQEGRRLLQMARSEEPHLFVPVTPPFVLEEFMELDSPVELLDSLLFVVGVMLEQLALRAAARALALASVTIALSLEGGTSHTRTIRPALPTNDRRLWLKLLHLDLEAHPPQAAILKVMLGAEPGHTSKVQLGLFSPQLPEPMRLDVTLARIRAIVGDDCVGSPALKDTHQPDNFLMEKFSIPREEPAQPPRAEKHSTVAIRQLRPAENVLVTLHHQQPEIFYFREKRYAVEHAYGPWLANGEWWNPRLWSLEQWDLIARAQDDAVLCCCLVRNHVQQCWQMVALYD